MTTSKIDQAMQVQNTSQKIEMKEAQPKQGASYIKLVSDDAVGGNQDSVGFKKPQRVEVKAHTLDYKNFGGKDMANQARSYASEVLDTVNDELKNLQKKYPNANIYLEEFPNPTEFSSKTYGKKGAFSAWKEEVRAWRENSLREINSYADKSHEQVVNDAASRVMDKIDNAYDNLSAGQKQLVDKMIELGQTTKEEFNALSKQLNNDTNKVISHIRREGRNIIGTIEKAEENIKQNTNVASEKIRYDIGNATKSINENTNAATDAAKNSVLNDNESKAKLQSKRAELSTKFEVRLDIGSARAIVDWANETADGILSNNNMSDDAKLRCLDELYNVMDAKDLPNKEQQKDFENTVKSYEDLPTYGEKPTTQNGVGRPNDAPPAAGYETPDESIPVQENEKPVEKFPPLEADTPIEKKLAPKDENNLAPKGEVNPVPKKDTPKDVAPKKDTKPDALPHTKSQYEEELKAAKEGILSACAFESPDDAYKTSMLLNKIESVKVLDNIRHRIEGEIAAGVKITYEYVMAIVQEELANTAE